MTFMEAGKPKYSQITDSRNLSVKTELQIVKAFRLLIRGIELFIRLIINFIKTVISEIAHPGSTSRI